VTNSTPARLETLLKELKARMADAYNRHVHFLEGQQEFLCRACHNRGASRLHAETCWLRNLDKAVDELEAALAAVPSVDPMGTPVQQRNGFILRWIVGGRMSGVKAVEKFADALAKAWDKFRREEAQAVPSSPETCGAEKCRCGHFACVHNGAQVRGRFACADCDCNGFEREARPRPSSPEQEP